MIASIDTSLIDWSRAQFALTAMYHWLFVPLTLGLGVIQAIRRPSITKQVTSSGKRQRSSG